MTTAWSKFFSLSENKNQVRAIRERKKRKESKYYDDCQFIRNVLHRMWRTAYQSPRTNELINYLTGKYIDDLKEYLLLKSGVRERGTLSIDHILPVTWAENKPESIQRNIHSHRNLRLITRRENITKNNKIDFTDKNQMKVLQWIISQTDENEWMPEEL